MKEKDLKYKLQQKFDFAIWKEILPLLFKKIDYFSHAENLFTENGKVIDGKQIGTVKLDDGKQLAIVTIEVDDSVIISRNRQELRKIVIEPIDQNRIHGALAFFYNRNQADYRFSFIAKEASLDMETGELIKGETKPKRYTYLLGANEACTTAAKRMLLLAEKNLVDIKQLKDVFSVEALNKDFFKSYKIHYEKFWKHLADEANPFRIQLIDAEKDDKVKQEKPIRDFVKKLLGRIVFLHFLQKKGWMGCNAHTTDWTDGEPRFMQQLLEDYTKPEKFHSQCLTKLFYETLNTKRPNDIFEVNGLNGKLNGSRVPYLNGGLFEPEKNKVTLEIDFPADFFKELLEFFDQYNFTIDENSPDDHEVGIDPEMLGHIFENLLEDYREKGAFYTPKEIVQYMCKESLIQYLLNYNSNEFRITNEDWKEAIEKFVRFHSVNEVLANKEVAVIVNQKLDDIKVCDPAIGSGAFPIGMLQEIFEAKLFIYPFTGLPEFKKAEVKKNIIHNSIYGVDLEKGAIDIAQLRFWLSLVVEELNPHPLPNLDFKIMQGNSLLERFEGVDLSDLLVKKDENSLIVGKNDQMLLFEQEANILVVEEINKDQLRAYIDLYFDFEEKNSELFSTKQEVRQAINEIIEGTLLIHFQYKKEQFEKEEKELNKALEANKISNNDTKGLAGKKEKNIIKLQQRLDALQEKKTHLVQVLQQMNRWQVEDAERPYFLWHLYFMDVFNPNDKSRGGFDVMIGNPPYIQLQKMGKETDILQEAGFETFARTGDIYCLFYEQGFNLLKEGGVLTYITSNKWMRGGYGKSLRGFFTKVNTQKILNLGPGVFHSATVDTNIYVGKKETFNNLVKGISIENRFDISYLKDDELIPMRDVNEDAWVVQEEADLKISRAFEKYGKSLREWNLEIYRGILTGFNEAFIIDQAIRDELVAEDPMADEIIRPILKGREIERYYAEWSKDFIINTHNGYKDESGQRIAPINVKKDLPSIWNYLQKIELELIEKRKIDSKIKLISERADMGWHWSNLRNCAYLNEFKKEKVIWKRIGSIMRFAYSNEEMYCLDSTCIATGEKIKYLTAVLNSKAGLYQLFKTSPQTGTGDQIISVQALEPLLVHYPSDEVEAKFSLMVDYILFIRKSKEQIFQYVANEHVSGFFEEIVDMMVYELYFEEEMKPKDIDVLQYVTQKTFLDITHAEDKKSTIQKVYYELQQKDNPIRNRILIASSRSETIARINAATRSI
jgi:hypothetical protein